MKWLKVCLCAGMLLSVSCSPSNSVRKIRLRGAEKGAAVLLLNAEGPGCSRNRLLMANEAGEVEVGPIDPACWTCGSKKARPRVAILSRGNAVAYFEGDDVCSRIEESTLSVTLRPRVPVVVQVWLRTPAHEPTARDDMASADWVFDRNMAGIELKPNYQVLPKPVATDCKAPPPESFRPDAINVYYGFESNTSCDGSNVLFIRDIPILGDSAHELGHTLGLNRSDQEQDYENGHTNGKEPSFSCSNTMWAQNDTLDEHLSMGQAFWMSLSCHSFVGKQRKDCLACSSDKNSPCCPFSVDRPAPLRAQCASCKDQDAVVLRELNPDLPAELAEILKDQPQFCTLGQARRALAGRFQALQQHVADKPELRLGSADFRTFERRWTDQMAVVLAVEAVSLLQDEQKRLEGLRLLRAYQNAGGVYSTSPYLRNSIERAGRGEGPDRCTKR